VAAATQASAFKAALQLEREAGRERQAGRMDSAARRFWSARDGFRKAEVDANRAAAADAEQKRMTAERAAAEERNAAQQQSQQQKTVVPEKEREKLNPPAVSVPAPTMTQPDKNPVKPPPASVVDESSHIRQVLRAYEAAWAAGSVDAMRRVLVLSSDQAKAIQGSFEQARYEVSVLSPNITIAPDGARATVNCQIRRVIHPKGGGRPPERTDSMLFSLEKRPDGWVIVKAEAR
jgi:hypothetical protein